MDVKIAGLKNWKKLMLRFFLKGKKTNHSVQEYFFFNVIPGTVVEFI